MKQVLFFIPTLSHGGAERVLCNLVNRLCELNGYLKITVLTLFKDDRKKIRPEVTYSYVFKHSFRGNVCLLKMFPARLLYKYIIGRRGKYDIVISYLQSPTMRIVGGCNAPSVQTINWIHNEFHSLSKLNKLYRSQKECIASLLNYSNTIYVSESARNAMRSCLPEIAGKNSHVIYNINDFDDIVKKSTEKMDKFIFRKDTFNLISVGRFTEQKGFIRLIHLIQYLKDNGVIATLYLLGDGSLRKSYIKEAQKLGIEQNICLLGYKKNPYKYIKTADLYICSSLHEGYSTAITESLAIGTPVLTTACSGMSELLGDNEYGIICENNEESLKASVLSYIKDKNKQEHYRNQAKIRGKQLTSYDGLAPVVKLFRVYD